MNMQFSPDLGVQAYLRATEPEHPVLFFSPNALRVRYAQFLAGFDGLVSYAVKANPNPEVLRVLCDAGMTAFDVASLAEIAAVRAVCPKAVLHYHNPVRSRAEIFGAVAQGVRVYSVDRLAELDKLAELFPAGGEVAEVTVRFKLPSGGAAYDFGAKFGAEPGLAAELMRRAKAVGFSVSLGFHPGTQCVGAAPWERYIAAAAEICAVAGVSARRLNLGGGWPSHRGAELPDHGAIFAGIAKAVARAFPARWPALVCEPGRGMVGDAMVLALRIKARDGDTLFLNDGRYGTLTEFADIGAVDRLRVPGKTGAPQAFTVFGPTCDSLDVLPTPLMLPGDVADGDYVLFEGMGAYSTALVTPFNGYGAVETVTLDS